jgi:hypothetical protein
VASISRRLLTAGISMLLCAAVLILYYFDSLKLLMESPIDRNEINGLILKPWRWTPRIPIFTSLLFGVSSVLCLRGRIRDGFVVGVLACLYLIYYLQKWTAQHLDGITT